MKTVIPAIVLLLLCVLLLGIRVLFVKGGRFPSGHIHDNAGLRTRGIDCEGHASHTNREK